MFHIPYLDLSKRDAKIIPYSRLESIIFKSNSISAAKRDQKHRGID